MEVTDFRRGSRHACIATRLRRKRRLAYRGRCSRGCGAATARLRRSRLLSPRLDSTPHLFMRDGSAGVRIGKPALDHRRKGKLSDDLLHRAVLRLILDKADELFLRGAHGAIVPLLWRPSNTWISCGRRLKKPRAAARECAPVPSRASFAARQLHLVVSPPQRERHVLG